VEGTGEDDSVAALEAAKHRAAVTARVDKGVQLAIAIPRDKDGLAPHVGGEVVVLVWDLALVGKIDPVAFEDVLHLEFEDLGVGEDVSGDPVGAPFDVVLHRAVERLLHRIEHLFPPRPRRLHDVRCPLS